MPRSGANRLIAGLSVIAACAGIAFPAWGQMKPRDPAPAGARAALERPVMLPNIRTLRVGPRGQPPGLPSSMDACNVVASHTDASFTGGSYTLQAGFAEQEEAAVSYTLPAGEFPIRINMTEVIVATSGATMPTTTKWTISYYSGTPSNGALVASYSSDGDLLPHIALGPGTNGVNLQFSIDPNDPEQIIIPDNGTHTFTVAFRIDDHNQQTQNPCLFGPPTCCNAFPVTDVSGLAMPASNWLWGVNCGALGCPPNGGWAAFAQLASLCRPSGDWVQRTTWSSVNCTPGVGACCLPDGQCQILTTANCGSLAGVYRGDGTDCATPCPPPTGACCLSNGNCLALTQPNCAAAGGTWLGGGTACSGSVCPTGGCCLPDGSCITDVTLAECAGQGGAFRGVGSSCAGSNCPHPTGACCLSNGACLELTQAECALFGTAAWQGPFIPCGPQACAAPCYPNCDGSTAAPILNVNDFVCFQQRFAAGDAYANCDQSTSQPVLNVNDFVCFQQRFAAGCN